MTGHAGIPGVMQRAMDGDSFLFRSDSGETYEVRLEGIDCPENGQSFADAAKRWLETVSQRRTIWIIPKGKDRYGRTLANVHNGDIWINGESVRLGLAWHYWAFNRDARLARLQMDAQAARVGVWQSVSPMPPWDFRKLKSRR
jgi:endonuclease YncB( thermonuclease family)